MGRRLGLIIGINQYQDPAFRPLQFAEIDARALAQWLVNVRGGKWSAADVQLVTGTHATAELVESLMTQTCVNMAEPGDLVFIYFAGHAFVDDKSGESYLACSNAHYQQPTTGLHLLSLVHQAMIPSRAAQIVLLLDCFQTGRLWHTRGTSPFDFKPLLGPTLLSGLQHSQGRLLYCTCRGNDWAPEAGQKNLGMFAYRMIIGLSGPALDRETGQVTLQRLHSYLAGVLPAQHRPQVFGQEPRPIVLVGKMPVFTAPSDNERETAPAIPPTPSRGQALEEESHELFGQAGPRTAGTATAQMSPTTSGQLSLAQVEQNRQQQCTKLLNQARQLVQMQNLPEAYKLVEQVLQMAPNFVDALVLKAQLLGSAGRFQEALAAVEQLVQIDPQSALVWSMRAALLANMGMLQEASAAIDRSLALDPNNPETQAIKATIQANMASMQNNRQRSPASSQARGRDTAGSFLLSAGLQILALIIGVIGASILIIQPHLPIIIAFLLQSAGLAVLCVNAARGAYLYGARRLLLTIIFCGLAAGLLGGIFKFEFTSLIAKVRATPPLIVPALFLAVWLVAAALLPLLAALGGFIGGLVAGVRRKG